MGSGALSLWRQTLLAHELVHVVQQKNGLQRIPRAAYQVGSPPRQVSININCGDVIQQYTV